MPHNPFSDAPLQQLLEGYLETVLEKIRGLETGYVLKASRSELETHFVDEARLEPLTLSVEQTTRGPESAIEVEVSGFDRALLPGSSPYVRGTLVRFDIPYSGTRLLWRYRPLSYSLGLPQVDITDDHISFYQHFPDDSPPPAERLKAQIQESQKALQHTVQGVKQQVNEYNARVPATIKAELDKRIQQAHATTNVLAGLGIPLKRSDTPPAYAVPMVRRPSPRALPSVASTPFQPEPMLAPEEYDHILAVCKSMAFVIERSPNSFASLDEESIRDHFLIQLNGHYGGDATGETFNAVGKTDILIRVRDRNIFIAECKFWHGEQYFQEAISQVLDYLSWRDSKCALLVFNTRQNTGAVAAKMHTAMLARPECRKDAGLDGREDHRYVFVKASDPGREIIITTQLFDVPRSS